FRETVAGCADQQQDGPAKRCSSLCCLGRRPLMLPLLSISNNILFVYYLISNLIYLVLLVTAIFRNTLHRHRLASLRLERLKASPFTPPIALLVPAHNEEKFIV